MIFEVEQIDVGLWYDMDRLKGTIVVRVRPSGSCGEWEMDHVRPRGNQLKCNRARAILAALEDVPVSVTSLFEYGNIRRSSARWLFQHLIDVGKITLDDLKSAVDAYQRYDTDND